MAAKSVSPASPLGEKHIFENQTVKLGTNLRRKAFALAAILVGVVLLAL